MYVNSTEWHIKINDFRVQDNARHLTNFFGNNPKYLGSIHHLIKVVTLAGKVLFLDRMVLIFVLSQVDVNSTFNLLTFETVLI